MICKSSFNRKKHQRAVNRFVRFVNKCIEQDPLWKGRFCVRQTKAKFHLYDDRSGGYLCVWFRFIDKEKKKYYDVDSHWYNTGCFFSHHLFSTLNDFIVKLSGVWDEHPTLKTTPDWRGRHVRMEELSPYTDEDFERMRKQF